MWRTQLHKGGSHGQEAQLRHHGIAYHKVVEPWGRQETWDSRKDTCGRKGCCVKGEMRQCLEGGTLQYQGWGRGKASARSQRERDSLGACD